VKLGDFAQLVMQIPFANEIAIIFKTPHGSIGEIAIIGPGRKSFLSDLIFLFDHI
jgi:hypothetical protein